MEMLDSRASLVQLSFCCIGLHKLPTIWTIPWLCRSTRMSWVAGLRANHLHANAALIGRDGAGLLVVACLGTRWLHRPGVRQPMWSILIFAQGSNRAGLNGALGAMFNHRAFQKHDPEATGGSARQWLHGQLKSVEGGCCVVTFVCRGCPSLLALVC